MNRGLLWLIGILGLFAAIWMPLLCARPATEDVSKATFWVRVTWLRSEYGRRMISVVTSLWVNLGTRIAAGG